MSTITFHSGLFDVSMTSEEVRQQYEDIQFLEDSVLMLINPDVAAQSDMYFSNELRRQYIKEYFTEKPRGYNMDFINNIFAQSQNKQQ